MLEKYSLNYFQYVKDYSTKSLNIVFSAVLIFALFYCSDIFASSKTFRTDSQFNAGKKDGIEVYGSAASPTLSLTFGWDKITPNSTVPEARETPFAYDGVKIVLFGGYSNSVYFNDTWEYSIASEAWQKINVSKSPSQRSGHGMSPLDSGITLLFGGYYTGTYSTETWKYENQNWTQIATSTGPSARAYFSMVKDVSTNKLVLFGGELPNSVGTKLSDEVWIYGSSWNLQPHQPQTVPWPSKTKGAAICSDNQYIYIYGGNIGTVNNQLWRYNVALNSWLQRANGPPAKEGASLFYDPVSQCLVLYGGVYGSDVYNDKVWYYKVLDDIWTSGTANNEPDPAGRQYHAMTYIPGIKKAIMFGGYNVLNSPKYLNDQYYYTYRSSGIYTSPAIDEPFDTSLQWQSISFTPQTQTSYNGHIWFQIASSTDNITWDSFRNMNGGVDPFLVDNNNQYQYPSNNNINNTKYNIICSSHTDRRYLKYRLFFNNSESLPDKPPYTPIINSVTLTYNKSPYAPLLLNPISGGSTNYSNTKFTWYNTTDTDNDILTYRIQVSNNYNFSTTVIDSSAIVAGVGTTSFSTSTVLNHGIWYWRVRANDGRAFGQWSSYFTLNVDKILPSAVTDLIAEPGSINGSAKLSWTPPGNNGQTGSIVNGAYKIWFGNTSLVPSTATATGSRTGSYSSPSPAGSRSEVSVTGLADSTTYYFAISIADQAGNYSLLSMVSPLAFTNAAPVVNLITPKGQEKWTMNESINWTSSDPNPGDTRMFNIYLSTDSGSSYNTTIILNLPFETTSYLWDTRDVAIGSNYRIKITAIDARGLSGDDKSISNITIFNQNEPPTVSIIFPNGGEVLYGSSTLRWQVKDPNKVDTHTFDVYLSSDSGHSFLWHFTSNTTYYILNTKLFHNRTSYRMKVVAADSGNGHLTGFSVSSADFTMNNSNEPPEYFSLLYPLNNGRRSIIGFKFQWESNGDPNSDPVTYTVYYSTYPNFLTYTAITQIKDDYCGVDQNNLKMETTYYWKVKAEDNLGAWIFSAQTFQFFTLSRFKAESIDGLCKVTMLSGLPLNTFVTIDSVDPAGNQSISLADTDTLANRHINSLGGNIYKISVCDINLQNIDVASPSLSITMKYQDNNNDGCLDNTPVRKENLNLGYLDDSKKQWKLSASMPGTNMEERSITSVLNSLGLITMLGATYPTAPVSGIINFPNPFAAGKELTRIRYVLLKDEDITINIYTLLGDLVLNKTYTTGTEGAKGQVSGYTNEITWDGKNDSGMLVANGMYLLEIKTGSERFIRKIGVVK